MKLVGLFLFLSVFWNSGNVFANGDLDCSLALHTVFRNGDRFDLSYRLNSAACEKYLRANFADLPDSAFGNPVATMKAILNSLSHKQQMIFVLRNGLDGKDPASGNKIAKETPFTPNDVMHFVFKANAVLDEARKARTLLMPPTEDDPRLNIPVADLNLDDAVVQRLIRNGYKTTGQLVRVSPGKIKRISSFGDARASQIQEALGELGLGLAEEPKKPAAED